MRPLVQILAATILVLAASPASGQEAAKQARVPQSRAMQWAVDTARVAGAAAYCAIDVEMVEDYISRAQVKIAAIATDKVDRVVAKIEFGNVFNVASSQEPNEGCDNFTQLFPQEASKLN